MERRLLVTGSAAFCRLFVFLVVCSVTTQSAPVMQEATGCNSECPAGYATSTPCNATAEASPCEPCEAGVAFNDAAGVDTVCRPCRVCPANSRVISVCDAVSDTQCQCLRDFYQEVRHVKENDAAGSVDKIDGTVANVTQQANSTGSSDAALVTVTECVACELCAHGWGAARACSPTQNTVCRKCPSGTFSSVLSSTLACSVCSVCRDDQVTLNECTPIQDTVCADKDMGHPSRRVITKPVEAMAGGSSGEYDNEGIISVYCAILGAIVLGLLIYVVMKQWRLRNSAKKLAHFEPRHGGSASVPLNGSDGDKHGGVGVGGTQCDISPCGSRRLNESDGSRGSRGSDSAFVAPGSDGYTRDVKLIGLDTRLREICTAKRREMEVMLNARRDQHDWKALARDLGYTSTRIASFEARAQEKQTGATRHLFADWAKREDSTVENLLRSLVNIGRHDVTLVMLPIQEPTTRTTLPRSTRYKPISVV